MDQLPLDGRITDLRAFAGWGEEGVALFLVDSTNAEVPGFTLPERELTPAIDQVFRTAPRRIIVSSFASHVHRIQQVIDAAARHGRKVAFVGRSMVRNMGIAEELGYLTIPDGMVVDLKVLEKLTDNKVTLICTGSQGEPMGALFRMANRDHMIRIGQGDTVLLASSLIPGNENAIYRVINDLTRWGATFAPAVAAITAVLDKAAREKIGESHQLEQLISRAIGQWVCRTHRRQPMIIPSVIDA